MNARARLEVLAVVICTTAVCAAAAGGETIDDYYIDFGVPDLSALTLIGANSNKVLRPGTMKELATGFLGVAGTGSDLNPGVAIDWTPVHPTESIEQYRESRMKYVQIAFGTVKDGDLTDFGFGVRWNVVDKSDPLGSRAYHEKLLGAYDVNKRKNDARDNRIRMEFANTAGSHAMEIADRLVRQGKYSRAEADRIADHLAGKIWDLESPPEPLFAELVYHRAKAYYNEKGLFEVDPGVRDRVRSLAEFYVETLDYVDRIRRDDAGQLKKTLRKIRDEFGKESWNAPVVSVAAGWVARSADSSWRALKGNRFSGIAGGAFPIGRLVQAVVQVEGRVAARDGVDERSSWGAGGRLIAAFEDRRVSIEGYYSSAHNRDPVPDTGQWRATIGLELKIAKGLWFEAAVGGEFDHESDDSTILALGNIKYGTRKEPRFEVDD